MIIAGRSRISAVVFLSIALVGGSAGAVGARVVGGGDPAAAQAAIDELTSALPGFTAVPGNAPPADVPECAGAVEADAAVAAAGGTVQAYGGAAGGVVAQIVTFDSKRKAKRLFKLLTNDDAEACVVASNEAGLAPASGGARAVADLTRGKLAGVKKSATLVGTITIGQLAISVSDAVVLRGKTVIKGVVGATGETAAELAATVNDWVKATAKKF